MARSSSADIDGFNEALDAYEARAVKIGQPLYLFYAASRRVTAALLSGHFIEAERRIEEAWAFARRSQEPYAEVATRHQEAILAWEQGRLDDIETGLPWFRSWLKECSFDPLEFAVPPAMYAWLLATVGRQEEAREAFDGVVSVGLDRLGGGGGDVVLTWSLLAEVAAELQDKVVAGELYRLLTPYAERTVIAGGAIWSFGAVARFLGLLAATVGRPDKADLHFQVAMRLNERLQARPALARAEWDCGRMLLGDDSVTARDRAARLIGGAGTAARDLGMAGLVSTTESALRRHGLRSNPEG